MWLETKDRDFSFQKDIMQNFALAIARYAKEEVSSLFSPFLPPYKDEESLNGRLEIIFSVSLGLSFSGMLSVSMVLK